MKNILIVIISLIFLNACSLKNYFSSQKETYNQGFHSTQPTATYQHNLKHEYVITTDEVMLPKTQLDSTIAQPANKSLLLSHMEPAELLNAEIKILAEKLIKKCTVDLTDSGAVAVSTFVNLDDLYSSSGFGRYISEQFISELHHSGAKVIELRKSTGTMIEPRHGEYVLSREMSQLSYLQSAHAILVGTYSLVGDRILVNARLLSNPEGIVISSISQVMVVSSAVKILLASESRPSKPKKPVKVSSFGN
jgi:TolB-like protein